MAPTAAQSSPPPSLLLLPAPPRPSSPLALSAAYRTPLTTVLSKLKTSSRPTTLVIAAACPILEGPSPRAKSVRWDDAQSLLAGLYTLVSVTCAAESIDVDVGAGQGSVDVRIVLVDHDPSRKYSLSFEGEYETNRTTVLDLAAFGSKVHPWETVFHPNSETGYALRNAFLGFAEKQSFTYQQLVVVDGGITMVAEHSNSSHKDQPKLGRTVCLGGTFDHLHPGHKLLLHATALLLDVPDKESTDTCTLIVGISGDELLVNKKHAEELQSWAQRAENVLSFLCTLLEYKTTETSPQTISKPDELIATLRDGKIVVRCVNIHDPFGPTITEEVMDIIVVSAETRDGGKAINDKTHRARGYIGHSIKIDGEPSADAARIAASLADKQPGEFFLVDANGGLSVETALRMLRLLPDGLDFVLEAPCPTARECYSLRRRSNIPIIFDELATDEASVVQLIADDAAEGIGYKISKNGGLTRGRRQRDICVAAGYTFSVQETTGSDIAFAAIVHLGQTVPEKNLRCILECRDIVTVKTADGDFAVRDGRVVAPTAPGLGITPRMDVLGEPVASYS